MRPSRTREGLGKTAGASAVFELGLRTHFNAAHFLRGYRGKCAALHGHRWEVEATLFAKSLDQSGMVCDFEKFKKVLQRIVDTFDHGCLNEIEPFDRLNPTAENIARILFERLKKAFQRKPLWIKKVRVWESPEAWAVYAPEEDV
ncbi:MAG: 6-carboxytetrahydropterin synthase QueD [Desulfobacterales bacterium]|nr:6-carboxytetrahydropterin synthase QueD [Desulfobacterales bacterium]